MLATVEPDPPVSVTLEVELLHVTDLVYATPLSRASERMLPLGAVTVIVEFAKSVTFNREPSTVMDSIVAEEPETLTVMPSTVNTVSVVNVTSSNAADTTIGSVSAMSEAILRIFFMSVRIG